MEEVRRHLAGLMARGALPPPWLDPSALAQASLPGLPPYILRAAAAPQQAQQRGQGGAAPGLAAPGAGGGWAPRAAAPQQQQQAQQAQRGLFQPSAAWDAIEEDGSDMDRGDASAAAAGDTAWDLGGSAGDDWDDAPDFLEAVSLGR